MVVWTKALLFTNVLVDYVLGIVTAPCRQNFASSKILLFLQHPRVHVNHTRTRRVPPADLCHTPTLSQLFLSGMLVKLSSQLVHMALAKLPGRIHAQKFIWLNPKLHLSYLHYFYVAKMLDEFSIHTKKLQPIGNYGKGLTSACIRKHGDCPTVCTSRDSSAFSTYYVLVSMSYIMAF